MNNKQFLAEISDKCGMKADQAEKAVESLVGVMEKVWSDGDALSLSGFGILEVRKKNERVSVNPVTGVKMLIPPKLTLNYKPSTLIKDRLKD